MVRNYKKKKNNNWTEEQMKTAISMVHKKKMSVTCAAKKYSIPKTTLLRHLGATNKELKVGKPTTLTYDEEQEIVATCHLFVEWGFGLSKLEVVNVVGDYRPVHTCTMKALRCASIMSTHMVNFNEAPRGALRTIPLSRWFNARQRALINTLSTHCHGN